MILLCFFIELFESGVLGLELGDDFLHQANHVRNDDGAAKLLQLLRTLESIGVVVLADLGDADTVV